MDPSSLIEKFLRRIAKRRSRVFAMTGFYLILASLAGGTLAGNLIGYFYLEARSLWLPFLVLWSLPVLYVIARYFLRGTFSSFSLEQAALFAEQKVGGLNNSLINSVQLSRHLTKERKTEVISTAFIQELIQRTCKKINGIDADSLVSERSVGKSRNAFIGILGLFLISALILPDFFARGSSAWFAAPVQAGQANPVSNQLKSILPFGSSEEYSIANLTLTFNYPAYTRLKGLTIHDSEGTAQVMPGTEIQINAETNRPVSGAELVLNGKDRFSMTVDGEKEIDGQFIAREQGYYQFQVKAPSGNKILLLPKYPIILGKDQPPRVILFLANPKPLYYMTGKIQIFYETNDDFGVKKIDLVIVSNGNISRRTLKTVKGIEKEIKGGYTWELSAAGFDPGDRVQYYLEVADNDNISGPNIGRSETFGFEIFDEQKARDDLLALQDELLERMIDLTAESLVVKTSDLQGGPPAMMRLKKVLSSSADQLIEIITLAQSIRQQAINIESFPKPYITFLDNIISGFRDIRMEQIEVMDTISSFIVKTSTRGRHFPPVEEMNGKLITRLETNILFLAKIISRERMNQVKALENKIAELTESLREEFEKAKNNEVSLEAPGIRAALEKIEETLQKIMEQLARQSQTLPDEFLNPNAFESISMENLSASIERLKHMVKNGMLNEAMKELEELMEDLRAFSAQIDNAAESMSALMEMQIIKDLDESLRKVLKLEKQQKELLKQTTEINKSLRKRQSKSFEAKFNTIFELLKKEVNQIQSILKNDDRYLEEYPALKEYLKLMDRESEISREIRDLNQKTVDAAGDENLSKYFEKLNEARTRLSQAHAEMSFLRMKDFQEFKEFLPRLLEKYDNLEEMADHQDLFEFNSIFKNTYPEIFRWQNHFRGARRGPEEARRKLDEDLQEIARLNSEISKKLGTVKRDLQQTFLSLISKKNEKDLEEMARKQRKMQKESREVAEKFSRMNERNPMITPQLANKMTATGKYMERAHRKLKKHNVPGSIEAENQALAELQETRDLIQQLKDADAAQSQSGNQKKLVRLGLGRARDQRRGGSQKMQRDRVALPSEDQYQVPGRFREEILKAMKNKYPKKYERLVMEYYRELVK